MNYEFDILAALVQLKMPNTKTIVDKTGISERKVQNVISSLSEEMGVQLEKIKNDKSWYFIIKDWGIFESGNNISIILKSRNLAEKKEQRLARKTKQSLLKSFADKYKYFEANKLKNYRESMRLEGYNVVENRIPKDKAKRAELKQQLLAKYSQNNIGQELHGR